MSRSARPMRGRKASRRVDTGAIEAMVRDGRIWSTLGKVMKPDSANEHWQVKDGKILIEVETLPDSMDLTCRLGTSGFGGGGGLWAIPPVGSIVAVEVPDGEVEFMPTIVGVLDNNAAPDRVSPDRVILVSSVPVEITAPKVILGPDPGDIMEETDGVVTGKGIDPFTGQTYAALGNMSSKVFANKS